MPIHINEHDGRNFLTVHVSGILSQADYERFVPKFEQFVQQHGKLRVLFDLTDFHGWEAAAIWEELKFDVKHLADIERLAVVGDMNWQMVMTWFSKPFMKATIHYFNHGHAAAAQQWLAEL
jgi:hypothetical protein